jgi:alkylation response protein AidB-like acyl-CoA dehydrogenase
MAEVTLTDCAIPIANRLGKDGRGASIAYARDRKQFGKPIGKFQSVANRIVDMKIRLDTARAV